MSVEVCCQCAFPLHSGCKWSHRSIAIGFNNAARAEIRLILEMERRGGRCTTTINVTTVHKGCHGLATSSLAGNQAKLFHSSSLDLVVYSAPPVRAVVDGGNLAHLPGAELPRLLARAYPSSSSGGFRGVARAQARLGTPSSGTMTKNQGEAATSRVHIVGYRDRCPDAITTRGTSFPLLPCWGWALFLIALYVLGEDWLV
jgi:hypothetical protein